MGNPLVDWIRKKLGVRDCPKLIEYRANEFKISIGVKYEPLDINLGELKKNVKQLEKATRNGKLLDQFQFYLCQTAKNYDPKDDYVKTLDSYKIVILGYLAHLGEILEGLKESPKNKELQKNLSDLNTQMGKFLQKMEDILLPSPSTKVKPLVKYAPNFALAVSPDVKHPEPILKMVKAHLNMNEDLTFLGLSTEEVDKLVAEKAASTPETETISRISKIPKLEGLKTKVVPGHKEFRYLMKSGK